MELIIAYIILAGICTAVWWYRTECKDLRAKLWDVQQQASQREDMVQHLNKQVQDMHNRRHADEQELARRYERIAVLTAELTAAKAAAEDKQKNFDATLASLVGMKGTH